MSFAPSSEQDCFLQESRQEDSRFVDDSNYGGQQYQGGGGLSIGTSFNEQLNESQRSLAFM